MDYSREYRDQRQSCRRMKPTIARLLIRITIKKTVTDHRFIYKHVPFSAVDHVCDSHSVPFRRLSRTRTTWPVSDVIALSVETIERLAKCRTVIVVSDRYMAKDERLRRKRLMDKRRTEAAARRRVYRAAF